MSVTLASTFAVRSSVSYAARFPAWLNRQVSRRFLKNSTKDRLLL